MEITDAEFTQQDIAAYCECGQSTISDLFRGVTKQPSYQVGERLVAMRNGIEKKAAPKPAEKLAA